MRIYHYCLKESIYEYGKNDRDDFYDGVIQRKVESKKEYDKLKTELCKMLGLNFNRTTVLSLTAI